MIEPRPYRPMLATAAEALPEGEEWVYEVKFDGYRALAYLRDGVCVLRSRNDLDLSARFPVVARAIERTVKSPHAVLDGELVRVEASGRASFSELQRGTGAPVYYAFDLLELDGTPQIELGLRERKAALRVLLAGGTPTVAYSEHFADGAALLLAARTRGLEGVVAKRLASPYREGRRTRDWLKVKLDRRDEFVIAGYTRGAGRRAGTFGALVLASNDRGALRYVGNVGTGFGDAELARLLALLTPLHTERPPFPTQPKAPRVRAGEVQWVEPMLVAEVRFAEWTHDRHLRQPVYLGLREDKAAHEVRRETPPVAEVVRKGTRELRLSNLDKLFWPDEGITKGDLVRYYQAVAPVLVPHLRARPFTMRRYPDGAFGKVFFQKDAPGHMPAWIRSFRTEVSSRGVRKHVELPLVEDELALLWMVNMGCIDMNPWTSRVDRPDRPDFVLFDLDPTPDVPWAQTVEVALVVKELLDALGLVSYPKTSGGKGFHVLVPLDRRSSYADARAFAEVAAEAIVRAHPKLATTEWSKSRRRGVLIDANQNGEGKTIASAYSVRPQAGAPVSTPLRWSEVNDTLDPKAFTMPVVLDRVRTHGDLHAGVLTGRQSLSKALRRLA